MVRIWPDRVSVGLLMLEFDRDPAYIQSSKPSLVMMSVQEKVPLLPQRPHRGQKSVLVIHGGAGTMSRKAATPERQASYKTALKTALEAGYAVLREKGEAMDAAVAAVKILESEWSRQPYRILP